MNYSRSRTSSSRTGPDFRPSRGRQRMPEPLAREYAARLMRQPFAMHLSPAGGIARRRSRRSTYRRSMIRDSLARGVSPRYLLPDPVLDYIRSNGLYVTQEVNEAR